MRRLAHESQALTDEVDSRGQELNNGTLQPTCKGESFPTGSSTLEAAELDEAVRRGPSPLSRRQRERNAPQQLGRRVVGIWLREQQSVCTTRPW